MMLHIEYPTNVFNLAHKQQYYAVCDCNGIKPTLIVEYCDAYLTPNLTRLSVTSGNRGMCQ